MCVCNVLRFISEFIGFRYGINDCDYIFNLSGIILKNPCKYISMKLNLNYTKVLGNIDKHVYKVVKV